MTTTPADPIAELANLALHVLDDRCSAVTMALPDDPAPVLRPMVEAVLAEAAAQQWIEQQINETGLKSMDFRNGMTMELQPARDMVAQWVGAARAMLGDAPNYTETPIEMVVKVAEEPQQYAFILQRVGKLTPHQARQQAEARVTELEQQLADTQPAPLKPTECEFLTYAVDLAADKMATNDGFTDEDEAALAHLRRLTAVASQPAPAVTEEPTPQCPAGLLPATDAAVDRCVRRGPHDTHETAAGALWPATEEPTP